MKRGGSRGEKRREEIKREEKRREEEMALMKRREDGDENLKKDRI